MKTASEIVDDIAKTLHQEGFDFQENVAVGGTVSDFYILAPSGSSILLEVKPWQPTVENLNRASKLASLYKDASGVDNAFVVIPGLESNRPGSGLVSAEEFSDFAVTHLSNIPQSLNPSPPEVRAKPTKHVFAAMPFDEKYDDTFVVAMQPSCLEVGLDCVRVDYTQFTGDIIVAIKRLIRESIAVIADLSESKPNVFYEMGFAEGLEYPIVQVCSSKFTNLPFDVRNNKTIPYSIGQTSRLRLKLTEALRGIIV